MARKKEIDITIKEDTTVDFFDDLENLAENKYSSVASERLIGDIEEFIDTGNYAFNAALSGNIYGGIPGNKITCLAGPSTTGKTLVTMQCVKYWQKENPTGQVFYFESEGAITKKQLINFGIDLTRIRFFPVLTIESFRTQALKVINGYIELKEKSEVPKLLIVLDSLGQLSTNKETNDVSTGEDKVDMTKAGKTRGAFRVLTLKASVSGIPILITNHTYTMIGQYGGGQTMGGGEGTKFAATQTIYLKKSREKDEDKDVVGVNITATIEKSRLTREGKKVEIYVDYNKGVDRYSGLLELGVDAGIIKKLSRQYEFPGEIKAFDKAIKENPEEYFTKDILNRINEYVEKEFGLGISPVLVYEEIERE